MVCIESKTPNRRNLFFMDYIDELKALGVNVDDALSRFMGNSALYVRMLGKLPKAVNDAPVMVCFEENRLDDAVANAHTLKGVMGNLSVTPLYEGYTKIVNYLRAGQPEPAKAELERILPIQKQIIDCIEKNS